MSDVAAGMILSAGATAARPAILPLEVTDLSLRFAGEAVLDRVTLGLGPTGCTVVMGPNGAGKSLLLKLLHGLIAPDAGRIAWGGRTPDQVMDRQAMVFQSPVLLRRSVAANVDFVLKARGRAPHRRDWLLGHVGLAHKADQPARLLSGGEAQRLALARALATDPDVLFLDEPTASLDPASTLAIERIVADAGARGVRVILVTHDAGQARRLADDVVFLDRGRVVEHGAATDFFPEPRTDAARAFLAGRIIL